MVFIEIVALLIVATVLITVITAVGKPVAEMLADKSRYKFKGLDSEAEARLLKRIESLEEELRQTRTCLDDLKQTSDFAVKMLEEKTLAEKALLEEKAEVLKLKLNEEKKVEPE